MPGSRVSPSGGADFKWHFTGAKGRTVRQINTPRVISPMAICWNRQPSKGGFFDSSRPLVMMCFGRRRHGTKESAIISVANLRPHNIHRSFGTATPYFFNLRNQVTQNGQRHPAYRLMPKQPWRMPGLALRDLRSLDRLGRMRYDAASLIARDKSLETAHLDAPYVSQRHGAASGHAIAPHHIHR